MTPATYLAAVAGARGDGIGFAKGVLLLVALLTGWAESSDDTASILHALLWLRRIDQSRFDAVVGDATMGFLHTRAKELDDQELRALCIGRHYDPPPPGSRGHRLARELSATVRARLAALSPFH